MVTRNGDLMIRAHLWRRKEGSSSRAKLDMTGSVHESGKLWYMSSQEPPSLFNPWLVFQGRDTKLYMVRNVLPITDPSYTGVGTGELLETLPENL